MSGELKNVSFFLEAYLTFYNVLIMHSDSRCINYILQILPHSWERVSEDPSCIAYPPTPPPPYPRTSYCSFVVLFVFWLNALSNALSNMLFYLMIHKPILVEPWYRKLHALYFMQLGVRFNVGLT